MVASEIGIFMLPMRQISSGFILVFIVFTDSNAEICMGWLQQGCSGPGSGCGSKRRMSVTGAVDVAVSRAIYSGTVCIMLFLSPFLSLLPSGLGRKIDSTTFSFSPGEIKEETCGLPMWFNC